MALEFAEEIVEVALATLFDDWADFGDGAGIGDDGNVLGLQVGFGEAVGAVDEDVPVVGEFVA